MRVSHYGMLLDDRSSENCSYNIVGGISLNIKWFLQIE
jgi:hypothetical protein